MELIRQQEGAPQEQAGAPQEQAGAPQDNPDVQAILARFEEEFPGVETPPEMLQKYASTLSAQKPENKERFMDLIVEHRRKMIDEGQPRDEGAMMEGKQVEATPAAAPPMGGGGY